METRLTGKQREDLAVAIKDRIDAASVKLFTEPPRAHLGASEIGEKCQRRLVYSFRWMWREKFDGRMLRLFNRGHREEERIISWLREAGFTVHSHTPDGKQIRIFQDQHHGGSLDGIAQLPPDFNLPVTFLLEFKTHGQNSFAKLRREGVRMSKPKHFAQMSEYGWFHSLQYAIYVAVNKNDDDIYIEIIELDFSLGAKLAEKANRIVNAKELPGRIAASSAHLDCKYCPMVPICHQGAPSQVSCRSCAYSQPVEGQSWRCNMHQAIIPPDAIPAACPMWAEFGKL